MVQSSKKPTDTKLPAGKAAPKTDGKVPATAGKRQPPGGSRKGCPNKTTAALKEAILQAAQAVGSDGKGKEGLVGYLKRVAQKDVKAFSSLLGKVLPLQVTGEDGGPVKTEGTLNVSGLTVDQLKAIASIPVDAG